MNRNIRLQNRALRTIRLPVGLGVAVGPQPAFACTGIGDHR